MSDLQEKIISFKMQQRYSFKNMFRKRKNVNKFGFIKLRNAILFEALKYNKTNSPLEKFEGILYC